LNEIRTNLRELRGQMEELHPDQRSDRSRPGPAASRE
jgi:hypothetical protein